MSGCKQKPGPLSPLVFDDPEVMEELAVTIYDLHESVVRSGVCYGTFQSEALREGTLGRIKAALASVFCTYFGRSPLDRFPDIFEQVSSMAEHLAKDHVFQDGNKRTSLLLVFVILRMRRIRVAFNDSSDPQANHYYQWIQDLVSGEKDCNELAEELRASAVVIEL